MRLAISDAQHSNNLAHSHARRISRERGWRVRSGRHVPPAQAKPLLKLLALTPRHQLHREQLSALPRTRRQSRRQKPEQNSLNGAEAEFKRALQLNPSDAPAWNWYTRLLLWRGHAEESHAAGRTEQKGGCKPTHSFAHGCEGCSRVS